MGMLVPTKKEASTSYEVNAFVHETNNSLVVMSIYPVHYIVKYFFHFFYFAYFKGFGALGKNRFALFVHYGAHPSHFHPV